MSHQQNHRLQRHAPAAAQPAPQGLRKQHSWSPDIYRDEAWLRRKGNFKSKRSKSVTDEDVDELKACIELGFGFGLDSPAGPDQDAADQRLSDTLPALELYYAVNKHYLSKSTLPSSSTVSDCDTLSPLGSPHTIFGTDSEDEIEAVGTGGGLFGAAVFVILIAMMIVLIFICLSVIG